MANRTIKELLQLTLDELKVIDLDGLGLCYVIISLHVDRVITVTEHEALGNYLKNNLPVKRYKPGSAYYWKPGTKACRIKWLTKQINSL